MGPPEPLTAIEEDLLVFDQEIRDESEWLENSTPDDLRWAFKHGWRARQVRETSSAFWWGMAIGVWSGIVVAVVTKAIVILTR